MIYDAKVKNRLKRIEGQMNAVMRMIEQGKDCEDVITQLSAISSAVNRTIGVIVTDNLVQCLKESEGDDVQMNKVVKEAMDLVVKSH